MATTLIAQIAFIFVNFSLVLGIKEVYEGTSFPRKYFLAETLVPTTEDLNTYLLGSLKIINAISAKPNLTDPNRALGVFYMKSILKRTLIENGKKLNDTHHAKIKEIIKHGDQILGYYFHGLRGLKWSEPYRRVMDLFRDDTVQTDTISEFNRHRLAKWLVNPKTVNNFARDFDEITMSKKQYAVLVNTVIKDGYIVSIDTSDRCMATVVYNRRYFDKQHRRCTADQICANVLYRSPSVAYTLSHRLLNLMMPRQMRRCYMRSVEADDKLMEALCASMYRETVYLARRGYFYRDLFLEHIALCGLLGYREFFRLHWFRKVVSWIDKEGCIKENVNFEYIRTEIELSKAKTEKRKELVRQVFRDIFLESCSFHQMALALMVMAHGVRYAAEFIA